MVLRCHARRKHLCPALSSLSWISQSTSLGLSPDRLMMHFCQASEEFVCVSCPLSFRARTLWFRHLGELDLCSLSWEADKGLCEKQTSEFLCDSCGPSELRPFNRFPFSTLPPKGIDTKAWEFCFIWPCGKHMSFHPACILPRRWTAVGAIQRIPAHLCAIQCLQTKSLVRVFPFWEVPLHPWSLCHLKHVTLMFQTHFSNVLHSI